MENVSQALYMAAGVLVAMMIIGVFVYVFKEGAQVSQNFEQRQAQEQLELFNSKFVAFQKENNTISDMISVINLAINTNNNVEFDPNKSVTIDIRVGSSNENYFSITSKYQIEKNYVFLGKSDTVTGSTDSKIYTYDLIHLKKKELLVYSGSTLEKTNTPLYITNLDFDDEETLSTVKTVFETNSRQTIYKFYFKCDDIQYHLENGRVSYMHFTMEKNQKYT